MPKYFYICLNIIPKICDTIIKFHSLCYEEESDGFYVGGDDRVK